MQADILLSQKKIAENKQKVWQKKTKNREVCGAVSCFLFACFNFLIHVPRFWQGVTKDVENLEFLSLIMYKEFPTRGGSFLLADGWRKLA